MNSTESKALIDQAVAGDRTALEKALLDCYAPMSAFIAARLPAALQGRVGVEDIIQQTFVQAFRGVKGRDFASRDAFLGWLRTVAQNCLADEIRKRQRKKNGGGLKQVQRGGDEGSSVLDLLDLAMGSSGTPSRVVAGKEAVQALQVALSQLNDDYRNVLTLSYLQGKELDEVARLMGRTPDAIRGLLYRAKKELRAAMGRSSMFLSK